MSTSNFVINENYVITEVNIDGESYECSLQIDADWVPYVIGYTSLADGTITGVCVGDEANSERSVASGDCGEVTHLPFDTDSGEYFPPPVETYTVTILYDGTKYTNMKCWHDYIWFTDRNVGNPLWSDGSEYLKYTVGYAPVNLQLTKVVNGEVVEESEVYIARGSGTWVVHDDGTWESYEEPKGKE